MSNAEPLRETFWKKYFCQPTDPRAGKWVHEVWVRAGWMTLSTVLFLIIILVSERLHIPEEIMIPLMFGIFAGIPELLLRRSWKIGLATIAFGLITCHVAFHLSEQGSYPESPQIKNLLLALGTTIGLGAGLGARSLLSGMLGLFTGGLGGLIGFNLYVVLREHSINNDEIFRILMLLLGMMLPIAILPGISVCLGLRWSKRS